MTLSFSVMVRGSSHMPIRQRWRRRSAATVVIAALHLVGAPALASQFCPAERPQALVPTDLKLCADLEPVVRRPSALPLNEYELKFQQFFGNFCHRNPAAGWVPDKHLRDTGPYIATLADGKWSGKYYGTHAPVHVWYSPEAMAWLRRNRPEEHAPADPAPMPDGAIMVKEMFPAPAAACADIEPSHLLPTSGAAIMVRDSRAAHDGWFWGWFGWQQGSWQPDWPAPAGNPLPNMGFGQYCVNCHASAKDNQTFASLKNIKGEPGVPLVFLSQHFFMNSNFEDHHAQVGNAADDPKHIGAAPAPTVDAAFVQGLGLAGLPLPSTVTNMPSQTYDNVWVAGRGPTVNHQFLTSDQCLGCHDAGGTGLQFDMTAPAPGGLLWNLSPYGTWNSSPMGLAGRDPIFFAQLASETETFHPGSADLVRRTCFGCHGIMGERQRNIDTVQGGGACNADFPRELVNAVPYPPNGPMAGLANYGALARDGVSCNVCHHMVLGAGESAAVKDQPQNACVAERQASLNPDNTGFARTFTGSFLVGEPGKLFGPFKDPKVKPMEHALGITPHQNLNILTSEMCGSCHTVHLPILSKTGATLGRVYEQATYPEWAFSAYRTGDSPDGPLPFGPGTKAQSCQACHMPSKNADGAPLRSKIAGIQEYTNFPQAENTLPPVDIDLPVREDFAKHTLVGLNVFFTRMAQQFPNVLGIRTEDPMLVKKGVPALQQTEMEMLRQARESTAAVAVSGIASTNDSLSATVTVTNKAGHKLPSGVGFRRAFVQFTVLDAASNVLWASGRTNAAGVIVDDQGKPIAGELWWNDDCKGRIDPLARAHQPHYTTITRQDQAQIYQELVSAPGDEAAPQCGPHAKPSGPLTTSFLSICAEVKDNRLLPDGYLDLAQRTAIAKALGAGEELAEEAGPAAVGDDPDYKTGGGDSLQYTIDLPGIGARAASVMATLYYQATPPFFLQDRFCTSQSEDSKRLLYLTSHLNLDDSPMADWRLEVVSTGPVPVK